MSLVIANNVPSLTAQNNLSKTSKNLGRSLERLSSGLKVNRGADGPAALVISEKQRAQIAGLEQAIENSEKSVSMVQTAEGALNEINNLLVKVRSLAIDSANAGVNDADALAANQAEINNAMETIDRIANNTQFGTKKLLDGSAGVSGVASNSNVTFLKGTSDTADGTYSVAVTTRGERAHVSGAVQTLNLAQDETLTVNGVTVTLNSGMSRAAVQSRINEFTAQTGVVAEDDPSTANATRLRTVEFGAAAEITVVGSQGTVAGGDDSGFGTTAATDDGVDVVGTINAVSYTGSGNSLTATSGAQKGITIQFSADTDVIQTVTGAQGTVTTTDNSLVFQIGPNSAQTANIAIDNVNSNALGLGVTSNQFSNLSQIDVQTSEGAQDAIAVIDQAIDDVTNLRGTLGAFQQNTLEATANNLRATLENTVNAESVIRDTDFAQEIANFTKQQVLIQAGTSVLSNANQTPQLVLSLLG